jgi:two-component system response regulator NreC
VSGQNRSQIAGYLGISPRTVEVHRANLRRKLGLHTHTDLVKYALKHGLLPLD